jgi:hypothetical protein
MNYKHNVESRKLHVKRLGVATLLAFIISLSTVSAQESVNATGGDASGSGGSASYSVGQVVYTTNTGTSGSVAQGVQQPFEISVVTGIEEANVINLSVSAYPNPAIDYLTLSIAEFDASNLSYQLYDMKGKLLQTKNLIGTETHIDMSTYVQSAYFVKVIQGNREIKTFKIIKN